MTIFRLDLIERVLWTALQAVAGALLDLMVSGDITLRAAGYAVIIAVLKALLATRIGDPNSAATLPSPPDHAIPDGSP